MSKTFETSRDEIARLCGYFKANRKSFLTPGIKEAHVRQSLIDPFWEALGWDVRNASMTAPQYREVIPEDSLDIEGQQKAPDYSFRVGTLSKFFVEAKRCGVNLSTDPGPAFQLRRYGWSAKVPLSILTDFEELGVYDCMIRPRLADKASHARIQYFKAEEYPDRWRELWDVFSREAVWSGAFDRYSTSKRKRGTSEVDSEFLKEIEGWRDGLARNTAIRNPRLSNEELNIAVQRTIDRIIFLRMAEDRGLEPYGELLKLSERPDIYKRFVADLCRRADEKYNSGLFHFQQEAGVGDPPDTLTPNLLIDDRVIKPILQGLYFENGCPYHFGVLPVEILGTVYERFLGKVIRLTAGHQAKIEEKPEVRKAGGVYYTPAFIVDYIVKQTVGKQVENRSPADLAGSGTRPPLRILDMACGSGSFLLGAYQYLLDHCLKWYSDNKPEKFRKVLYREQKTGSWRLSISERKRILTTHIFGVDIDQQAVEVTKLSLLLKALEGENDSSLTQQMQIFQERALPNLSENIKCGNSLIGPDYFTGDLFLDVEELRRVNPFEWVKEFPHVLNAGGFDCVIGNPPYIRIQTLKEWAPLEVEIIKRNYSTARSGNYDIYVVFVEVGLSVLNGKGMLGFILPHKFFNAQYGQPLRKLIADGHNLSEVIHFGDQQIFPGATTYTCMLFLSKGGINECHYTKVSNVETWRTTGQAMSSNIPASALSDTEWNFAVGAGAKLFARLQQEPVKLRDVARNIFQGIVTSSDSVYLLESRDGDQKGAFVGVFSSATNREYKLETGVVRPLCKGARDIRRYHATPSKWVLFPYDTQASAQTGKAVLIPEATFLKKYPKAWAYLRENYETLRNREKGKMKGDGWYGYVYPKSIALFGCKKILTPSIAANASFTLDLEGRLYFVGSGGGGGGGYGIILKGEVSLAYEYVLGLLNSKLLDFYLKIVSSPFSGGYYAYNRQYIEQLPIRSIDCANVEDKGRHDKIVMFVGQLLDLYTCEYPTDTIGQNRRQRLIDSTTRQIDALVYDLYGLTQAEINVVEASGDE